VVKVFVGVVFLSREGTGGDGGGEEATTLDE
jgi:hypothetical protein